jgi:hypothetical protein
MSRTIQISEETWEKIKDQVSEDEKLDINDYKDFIGKKLFIRTVTYHMLGKATKFIGKFIVLETASWIPDTSRFMNFIKKGELYEVEPVGSVMVNIDTIIDIYVWKHELPIQQL